MLISNVIILKNFHKKTPLINNRKKLLNSKEAFG